MSSTIWTFISYSSPLLKYSIYGLKIDDKEDKEGQKSGYRTAGSEKAG